MLSLFYYSLLYSRPALVASSPTFVVTFAGLPFGGVIPPLAGTALLSVGVLGPIFAAGPRCRLLPQGGPHKCMGFYSPSHKLLEGQGQVGGEEWL